jgi:aspartyl-tRNA(Asn)/glutamyl-tRNA(Gln) amidotransferase subunit B
MNSITNIAKAMEYEFERQTDLIDNGGKVVQETLRYDDATGTTSSMRSKEDAHDYRYFRDPDLVTINVSKDEVEEIKATLPELPADKCKRYIDELDIPEKDAQLLTKYRNISEYFDKACDGVKAPKTVSNFIIGQIFRRTETEADKEIFDVAVTPAQLNELVKLLDSGKIRNNLAKSTLEKMLDSGKGCMEFISESDMGGLDENAMLELCKQAVESNPKAVSDYKGGKEKAIKSLVGFVMKNSRGKADAAAAEEKIKEIIG